MGGINLGVKGGSMPLPRLSKAALYLAGIETPVDPNLQSDVEFLRSRLGNVGVNRAGHDGPVTSIVAQKQGNTIRIVMPGEKLSAIYLLTPQRGRTFSDLKRSFLTAFPEVELGSE